MPLNESARRKKGSEQPRTSRRRRINHTNHHVVDGAEDIRVELTDNRTFPARRVGSAAPYDLAVLKIDANHLPVLPPGDSDKVRVGDVVLAVGNPLGLGQTVTMGVIPAKGRSTGLSDGSFEDFLQTDGRGSSLFLTVRPRQ